MASFKINGDYFANFLRKNEGIEAIELLEKEIGANIRISDDECHVGNDDSIILDRVKNSLTETYFLSDFQRALEIITLCDNFDSYESYSVNCTEAFLIQRQKRLLMRESGAKAIEIDEHVGTVTIFGSTIAVLTCRCKITQLVCFPRNQQNMASALSPYKDVCTAVKDGSNGPCTLSFWVPERAARLVIGKGGHNVDDFERLHRCLVDFRTPEKNADCLVPIDITTKDLKTAYNSKDALFRFIDRHIAGRDWPKQIELSFSGCSPLRIDDIAVSPSNESKPCVSTEMPNVTRMTFMAASEDAPRLIGTRGLNKRRLEERTNSSLTIVHLYHCHLLSIFSLRTEEKHNGMFPVDIVAHSPADCERAKAKIKLFLDEKPRFVNSPRKPSISTWPKECFFATTPSENAIWDVTNFNIYPDSSPFWCEFVLNTDSDKQHKQKELNDSFLESVATTAIEISKPDLMVENVPTQHMLQ